MSLSNTSGSDNRSAQSLARACAAASPVPVIRGETPHIHLAHIDWLAFTIPSVDGRDWRWLRDTLQETFHIPTNSWHGTDRKWSGYQHRVDLLCPLDRGESILLGLVGYGGKSQRGTMHVSLNASACARITDWQLIHDWGQSVFAVITRVDTAHDDFEGKTLNIEDSLKWHKDDLFSSNGRPPTAQLIDDLGSNKGKTLNVGNRANGKFLRIYEKGKKEGDTNSNWVRAEVEWKNQSRIIPWDILLKPGNYLAGAYPCLSYLSEKQDKIKTIQKSSQINYEQMVEWLKNAAGKSINAMLLAEGGDIESVFKKISRKGFPKRLEAYSDLPHLDEIKQNEDIKS